ncbi:serine/threonine-protein kinase BLUS1 [Daucus carota subsp. sativus]|uniref:Protein kinase domain-containing protein n=1 Tax=Daucus carota subsp. sativus TaxID=79200 RepID=A0A161Y057_DAUCS|nr:PREDICTED: serine/threonine-protein kinase BLUS1 [Daucus carota subsp. sativus]XP_017242039.1 PREDICTED: serine/threonine-protein kinase BLUS1 [Daucus carota subsp. sativus]XP_017242040.1 PREDICTED: serine/threonine-protein kinase BLUS1 [Daucus carota subsp. sativus]XP_017242041.1 PREDICTED: serine/threonine-protein kinase BLUS1 [Daucus carota subsp. sativus]XP_017242042.1 PREDICTED: serine/threonine-protein kinase BLUS1 [Daucus carota subsp. sativus]XP_017242043.1 PREDICTED: serine/threoni
MSQASDRRFPLNAQDYRLFEEVGEGVSATVYRALCVPLNETVAIKVLDLEKCNNDLDGIRREVQTMSLINHPNLLRAHCSFTSGHNLWVVMPYMAGGSCLHIMKSAFPEGLEEPVIATLLREVLKALVYLHAHGHIHRDVKAGNILVDSNGAVKLADFGVSAGMFDTGDRQRSRNTFVGTPCWMAPEVMQQLHGYDFKADIWSFGITALELAHGHAPFSKYPPMKVLLMTLQNAPPGLDYERDRRFSKSFKELVAACLVKDPKKRPSSEKLLKHHFFKHARSVDYLSRTILEGLSPLGDRFRTIKAKEAEFLVQNKALLGDKEQLSQQEYIRGISAWNFNLEDLKNQAALIQDYDAISNIEESSASGKQKDGYDEVGFAVDNPPPGTVNQPDVAPHYQDGLNDIHTMENSLAAFPMKPLQALKGCFDVCNDEEAIGSPSTKEFRTDTEQPMKMQSPPRDEGKEAGQSDIENAGESTSQPRHTSSLQRKYLSGSFVQDHAASPKKVINDAERDPPQTKLQPERNFSGPLQYRLKKDIFSSASVEDAPEGAVVQRKGRFKVTSADPSPKIQAPLNGPSNSGLGGSASPAGPSLAAASVLPSLQCILQQNTMQKDEIVKLIKCVEQLSVNTTESSEGGSNDPSQIPPTSYRERELQSQLTQLQQSVGSLVEELQRQKLKNVQLEKKLISLAKKEEDIQE